MFTLLLIAISLGGAMVDVKAAAVEAKGGFFPSDDYTTVKWQHAVNSKTKLDDALKSNALMLEADVSVNASGVPIMAHPPDVTSDLTLENFLTSVLASSPPKGIKLDFKSTNAVNASVPILTKYASNFTKVPVWLNADILKGPGGEAPTVDAATFLDVSKNFSTWTVSVGWTTNWSGSENYTLDAVKTMNDTLTGNKINQPVTFAVRASLAANSDESLKRLVSYNQSTLTVWSPEKDANITFDNLRKTILDIGRNRTFVDMPKDQFEKLRLTGAGSQAVLSSACVLVAAGTYLTSLW